MVTKLSARKTPVAKTVDSPLKAQLHSAVDTLFGGSPECSVKRVFAAGILAIAVSLGVGAIGGTLFGLMMIGAAILTWPMFIILAIYIIGMLITMWLSSKVFDYTFTSVIDRSLETTCVSVKHKVTERFARVTGYFNTSRSAA